MRSAFVATLVLLGLLSLSACANDSPPTFAGSEPAAQSVAEVDHQQSLVEARAAVAHDQSTLQSQAQSDQESLPRANRNILLRLTKQLDVYQWIGDDWLPFRSFGPMTLLLADGWVEQDNGVIWLHLDLNGDLDGWVRLNESPVSLEEARSLPRIAQPDFPATQLATPDSGQLAVSLLGISADRTRIAVRFVGSDAVLWVDRWDVEGGQSLGWLPVYTGTVSGQWEPWHVLHGGRLEAQISSWNTGLAAWPGGPEFVWRLQTGSYPVLGRSLDAKWLALRVDALDPPVVWAPAPQRGLDFKPVELPIFLSPILEVVTIGSDGDASSSRFATERWSYWEWRNETELLLSDGDAGTWLWDLQLGETRKLSDRTLSNISPNGAFAVDIIRTEPNSQVDRKEPNSVALVSLDNGTEFPFAAVHKPWGTDAPGFQQYWSADSKWLLSTVARYNDEGQRTRWFALSVTGEMVEIVPPEGAGAGHWTDLQRVEQAGGTLRYLNAEGEEVERPWSDEVFGSDAAAAHDVPELPDGWWPRRWSADGEWLMATRARLTSEFDDSGMAALPWLGRRGWGIYEIGIFNRDGELRQVFRGFGGLDCGQQTSTSTWSPDGSLIVFGPRWTSCA